MRIPVTTLESFRLFRDYDFIEQDEMIARINRHPIEPNEKMYLGSALHKVLEKPEQFTDGANFTVPSESLKQGDFAPSHSFTFDGLGVHEILHGLPHGIAELKTKAPFAGVTLSGIVDLISGTTIYDHKVSTKAAKPDSYSESVQWRCYLEMFGCDRFVYQHIQVRYDSKREFYEVLDVSRFEHYRYPMMASYLKWLIGEYLAFCRDVGIKEAA